MDLILAIAAGNKDGRESDVLLLRAALKIFDKGHNGIFVCAFHFNQRLVFFGHHQHRKAFIAVFPL